MELSIKHSLNELTSLLQQRSIEHTILNDDAFITIEIGFSLSVGTSHLYSLKLVDESIEFDFIYQATYSNHFSEFHNLTEALLFLEKIISYNEARKSLMDVMRITRKVSL